MNIYACYWRLFSLLNCALLSNQESGATAQSSSSTSVTERLGSNILEPSSTTGDALDKYLLVSEKVIIALLLLLSFLLSLFFLYTLQLRNYLVVLMGFGRSCFWSKPIVLSNTYILTNAPKWCKEYNSKFIFSSIILCCSIKFGLI